MDNNSDYCEKCGIPLLYPDKPCPKCASLIDYFDSPEEKVEKLLEEIDPSRVFFKDTSAKDASIENSEEYKGNFSKYFVDNSTLLDINSIEKLRLKYLLIFWCLLIFLLPTLFYLSKAIMSNKVVSILELDFFIPPLALFLFYKICKIPQKQYKKRAKAQFFPIILKYWGNLNLVDHKKINYIESDIASTPIFPNYLYDYNIDELIIGKYKETPIKIAELTLKALPRHNNGPPCNITVFKGIIIVIRTDNFFNAQTIIVDKKEWIINFFKKIENSFEKISISDPIIKKVHVAYSTNHVEAKKISNSRFLKDLVILCQRLSKKAAKYSFNDNDIVISIPSRNNFFEPASLFISAYNTKCIEKVFLEISTILEMIDVINKIGENI